MNPIRSSNQAKANAIVDYTFKKATIVSINIDLLSANFKYAEKWHT